MLASPRRYAAFSLLRRRPQERRSLTATRDRPDVSHRRGNLRPAEVFNFANPDGMLRFRCCGDVTKRDAAPPPPGTGQTQLSLAQLSPAQLSPAQLPARLSPARLSSAQLNPAQLSPAQLGSAQRSSVQPSSAHLNTLYSSSAHLNTAHLSSLLAIANPRQWLEPSLG